MNKCSNCSDEFNTDNDYKDLLEKVSPVINGKKYLLPLPSLCPDCRQQRRLAYRNEKKFYKTKCKLTDEDIVSVYSPDKECVVLDQNVWWSDDWDPLKYGQDFDFNRSFFDQFYELSKKVPRPALVNMSSENSLYTNHCAYNKNYYMCINTGYSEDCFYCTNYNLYNKDCVDCLAIQKCERCYFCVDTRESSFSSFLLECKSCLDSMFCYDCRNVKNCFGCYSLRNKEYYIYNKPYSKSEYEKLIADIMPKSWADIISFYEHFMDNVKKGAVHRYALIINSQNCSSHQIQNSKNVNFSYFTSDSEDCLFCYDAAEMKDCIDATEPFTGELTFETHACNIDYNCTVLSKCYENNQTHYSQYCWYCENVFGCFGLKKHKFCILNKQYSETDYYELVDKIITHMRNTGEWGEFFPIEKSGFCYNETVANEYYPLSKDYCLNKGYKWTEKEPPLPERHQEANLCEKCGKQFIYTAQEIKFYDNNNLIKPMWCFNCRHDMRFTNRPTRQIISRVCQHCGKQVDSVYSEEEAAVVYCDSCYLQVVQ